MYLRQCIPNLKSVVGKAGTPTKFTPVLNSEVKMDLNNLIKKLRKLK